MENSERTERGKTAAQPEHVVTEPLAKHLSREYRFSTSEDSLEAMRMGRELFNAARGVSATGETAQASPSEVPFAEGAAVDTAGQGKSWVPPAVLPSCTVCGKPMGFVCKNCGSVPEPTGETARWEFEESLLERIRKLAVQFERCHSGYSEIEELAEQGLKGETAPDVEVFADHADPCMQPIGLTTCGYPRAHSIHNNKSSMSYHEFVAGETAQPPVKKPIGYCGNIEHSTWGLHERVIYATPKKSKCLDWVDSFPSQPITSVTDQPHPGTSCGQAGRTEAEERAAFEKWVAVDRGYPFPLELGRMPKGEYKYSDTRFAWMAWLAARGRETR